MFNVLNYFDLWFIIKIIVILIGAFVAIKIFSYILFRITPKFSTDFTVTNIVVEFFKYLVYVLAISFVLESFGVDISGIILSLGIIGVSIGFAAKDIVSNFMSGIFLLIDKTVKLEEIVEVNGVKGKVEKLGLRTTTLITTDNAIITVPNSVMSKSPYTSHTFFDEHRVDLNVVVPLSTDLKLFNEKALDRIGALNWTVKNSKPRVIVKEIIDTGIQLQINVWANDYSKLEENRLQIANEVKFLLDNNI
ncbi:mechanosensitive ion channel family protein [Methanobrevibacter filiformis]|uniref:Low conductance mechanosensitive channel YnaI n=1 Tax=Methanobrevibacter filiformis TaxID=55758 RepID=A0A166AGZ3_9EURY|nr:mechanosensitive ion channel family protein [Methanobrevibacter filiformis]KZX12021.1 Low conductance mechanosensitive channel YnaI [Methanobrevibacter filiformis]